MAPLLFLSMMACCLPSAPGDALEPLAPRTIEEAETLGKRFKVQYTEEEVAPGSMGACGHSPACVLVPLVQVFSAKSHRVTLTRKGELAWTGLYDTEGDLVEGTSYVGDEATVLRRVALPELDRTEVLEVARGRPGAEGEVLDMVRVEITPQVDLVSAYSQALQGADARRTGRLLAEAWPVLGPELASVAAAQLASSQPDLHRAHAVSALCEGGPDLLAAAEQDAGVHTRAALSACAEEVPAGSVLCASKARWVLSAVQQHDQAWLEGVQGCDGPGAAVLALALDQPPEASDLSAALLEEDVRPWLLEHVESEGLWRTALFSLLDQGDADARSTAFTYIHTRAARRAMDLTPAEVESIARAYARSDLASYDRWFHPKVVEYLEAHKGPSGDGARRILREALDQNSEPEQQALLALALMAMGDDSQVLVALSVLEQVELFGCGSPEVEPSDLACSVLHTRGCTSKQLEAWTPGTVPACLSP